MIKIRKNDIIRSKELIDSLFNVWQASVRATHHFLSEADLQKIVPDVFDGLKFVESLLVVENDNGVVIGFAGIEGRKLEMLFLHPSYFRLGIGRKVIELAVNEYDVNEVDVNEQNPSAKSFYEEMGFVVYARDNLDGQGNPFPILHMRLK